jgi:hypothetical protein
MLCLTVFLSSNLLLGINPFSRELHVIRLLSICVIIYILYYNSISYSILTAIILPLSLKRINYFEFFKISKVIDSNSKNYKLIVYKDIENQISDFLFRLDFNDNFIIIMEFIPENRYF